MAGVGTRRHDVDTYAFRSAMEIKRTDYGAISGRGLKAGWVAWMRCRAAISVYWSVHGLNKHSLNYAIIHRPVNRFIPLVPFGIV